jgi:hypothetical protein
VPNHCLVSLTIQKYLSVIDGRHQGWSDNLREQLGQGNNLFVILPNTPDYMDELCDGLDVKQEHLPKPVNRHRLFSLSPFIDTREFDELLAAQEEGSVIFFVEQLDLPRNQPPNVKPFMVYCSVRGIVSQHDNQREARDACADYLAAMSGLRNQHEATVFKWRDGEWHNTETC